MKIRHLALLSAFVPLAALISGCGGGSSGPATPNTNPTTSPTDNPTTNPTTNPTGNNGPTTSPTFLPPQGTPSQPTRVVPQTVLTLPNGELGILNLSSTGRSILGTLRVINAVTTGNQLDAGVYPLAGILAAPTAFTVSNNGQGADGAPTAPKFTLTGDFPVGGNRNNGSYTFTRGTFVSRGILLKSGNIFIPNTAPYRPIGNLQFAQASPNANEQGLVPRAVTPTGPDAFDLRVDPGDGSQRATLNYDFRDNPLVPRLRAQAKRGGGFGFTSNLDVDVDIRPTSPFVVGQSFSLQNSDQAGGLFATVGITTFGLGYSSRSGTATVRSITGNSVALDFRNVILSPNANNPFTTNITMNGSFEATGFGAFVLGG